MNWQNPLVRFIGTVVLAGAFFGGIVIAASYTTGHWPLDSVVIQVPDGTALPVTWQDRLERVATAGLLIGGLFALGLASWRAIAAHRQADAAQEQIETALQQVDNAQKQVDVAQQQAETSYQGLLNERYQKGAEMLGSDVLAVRLAGIYTLGQLGDDHPEEYYILITRLLSAFVRHVDRDKTPKVKGADSVRVDVNEAVGWIGSHRKREVELSGGYKIDLTGAYLREAQLEGLDLSSTTMVNVNLQGAWLWGAHLRDAHMWDSKLQDVALGEADLTKARLLRAKMSRANLGDSILLRTNLGGADLSCDVERQGTEPFTNLSGANLTRANLSSTNLAGVWAPGVKLYNATMLLTNLSGAELSSSPGAKVRGLRQEQVNRACWDGKHLPAFYGTYDEDTRDEIMPPEIRCRES